MRVVDWDGGRELQAGQELEDLLALLIGIYRKGWFQYKWLETPASLRKKRNGRFPQIAAQNRGVMPRTR
jgi:hypothetical protein